jgi:hypothetical protein
MHFFYLVYHIHIWEDELGEFSLTEFVLNKIIL